MKLTASTTALAISLLAASTVLAQTSANNEKQEFAVTLGAMSGSSPTPAVGTLALGSGVAFEASYARNILGFNWAKLYWEADGLYSPVRHLSGTTAGVTSAIHSVYVTQGFKLQFSPDEKISPWLWAGDGLSFYNSSTNGLGGGTVAGGNRFGGNIAFGGGVDIATGKKYVIRGDVRCYYTGRPNFDVATSGGQFNFVLSGGIVWRMPKK